MSLKVRCVSCCMEVANCLSGHPGKKCRVMRHQRLLSVINSDEFDTLKVYQQVFRNSWKTRLRDDMLANLNEVDKWSVDYPTQAEEVIYRHEEAIGLILE